MSKRRYEQRKRAEQVEATRRRITEATVELHVEVGPAQTRVAEIARRAGVRRPTVYAHFPDERSLFAACSAHWRGLHPAPDPARWAAVDDPHERLRTGLGELYAWYRETAPMTANVLRDAETLPALREVAEPGIAAYRQEVERVLGRGLARRAAVQAALGAATEFQLWRALAGRGLADRDVADLLARIVEAA